MVFFLLIVDVLQEGVFDFDLLTHHFPLRRTADSSLGRGIYLDSRVDFDQRVFYSDCLDLESASVSFDTLEGLERLNFGTEFGSHREIFQL